MDLLEDVLAQPHAREAFLLRVAMGRPWSVTVEDEAPLSIVTALRGGAWVAADGSPSRRFEAGEVLVVRSPTSYTLSSDQQPWDGGVRIGIGQVCSGPDGRDLSEELRAGVRTWGNDPQGEDQLLVGTYRHRSELGRLILQSLPPWFLVSAPVPELVSLLARETAHDGIAQSSVLDRLLDVLLVTTLRAWVDEGTPNGASLLSASRDEVVRRTTEAVRADPSRRWTVESLAALAGVSRASLTRRFNATLGVAPMTYVTQWRLATAADLLDRGDATLSAIAHQVGYSSPFSLSSAFKSRYGVSPRDFRAAAAASRDR
ncbi:AraC family transcriptional regulator [Actinomyces howellii]|uniref:Bacillibactin transport regulator n=1 Tax=Actinomyces howellii TaxID=52771 RepID=A0A3S4V4M3_9ACTO|nr:AraC family transcriptional regulator [Actinomyces howellii]VEG28096.1 Bacillibactin transport regulator [Actinomyces howellii]